MSVIRQLKMTKENDQVVNTYTRSFTIYSCTSLNETNDITKQTPIEYKWLKEMRENCATPDNICRKKNEIKIREN